MTTIYSRLMHKLSQESTWRGLVALAMAFGTTVDPARAEQIIAGGLAIIGLINVIKEK
jgi:hypothetical protein